MLVHMHIASPYSFPILNTSVICLYYNDTLLLTPAEILVSSVDTEGHIDRLSTDRRHNLFGYNSAPYYRVLKSTRPVDHILIDVLSNSIDGVIA